MEFYCLFACMCQIFVLSLQTFCNLFELSERFWLCFSMVAGALFLKRRCKGNTFSANLQIFLEKNAKKMHFFGILPFLDAFFGKINPKIGENHGNKENKIESTLSDCTRTWSCALER